MENENLFGIIITVLLSLNGVTLTLFVTNVKELKKVIQDLALTIRSNQNNIEYLSRSIEIHEKILEKHSEEIEAIKIKAEQNKGRTS